jgi:hypothetical protein
VPNYYLKVTGTVNNVFRPQNTLKKTRLQLYNTLALPALLYGSEIGQFKGRDARRITATEMKYMRRTTGYTWTDHKTKYRDCGEIKYNRSFGQNTGLQEKLDTACK